MTVADDLISSALVASNEEKAKVEALMTAADVPAPEFWHPGVGEEMMVPVDGAELRVFHFPARDPAARRPVVMVPGFGATPEGFQDFYAALRDKAELFYIETREKSSSWITARHADMSVGRSAHDIQQALSFLGLAGARDFVLVAPCWGASIVLQGLIEGSLDAPTVLVADPMHSLWFPRWVLRYVSPLLPAAALLAIRPFVARSMLGDMQEPTQKRRAWSFVYGADLWKWKKSAEAARDFDLYGRLSAIGREVFVLNGTKDKIHDQRNYPRMAREMPHGRFISMQTDERHRERLFGVAALEFARVCAADGLPPALARYEKRIR
jgi:pimeloyl-ACP methyl ester carboxylesterase